MLALETPITDLKSAPTQITHGITVILMTYQLARQLAHPWHVISLLLNDQFTMSPVRSSGVTKMVRLHNIFVLFWFAHGILVTKPECHRHKYIMV